MKIYILYSNGYLIAENYRSIAGHLIQQQYIGRTKARAMAKRYWRLFEMSSEVEQIKTSHFTLERYAGRESQSKRINQWIDNGCR